MSNEKIVLECSKEIASLCQKYYPSCDKAYFQGIYAEDGDLISVDVFFEKDKMLLRKNIVMYFDLIDCHQPRNVSDQKDLIRNLMKIFQKFAEAYKAEFEPCFTASRITVFNEKQRHIRVEFVFDEHILDDLEGGAHEYHQKYYEEIEKKVEKNRWWRGAKWLPFVLTK